MATLLEPARLPLSVVEEALDSDGQQYWEEDTFTFRHDYLKSLALGGEDWVAKDRQDNGKRSALGLALPRNIAAKGNIGGRAPRRALSEPFVPLKKKMATAVETVGEETDTAPSSPPELSYSKSSKSSSSSVRSDSSDEDESTGKSAPFEDVTTEDSERESIEDSNLRPESRPTLKRLPPRSMTTNDVTKRLSSSPINDIRQKRFPHLQTIEPPLRPPPNGLGLRKVLTSPSAPSLFTTGVQRDGSSRSPSPTKPFMRNGVSVSPQTLASANPKLSTELRSPTANNSGIFSRRKSWQPGTRKTAKEIEAEYNDDDEEVPAEAILENVPISPMPGQPRGSQSLSRPESRSTTPSPQRRPLYTNLHSANVPKGAKRPSAPTMMSNGQYAMPRSPRRNRPSNMLHHSNTMPAFPPGQLHRKQRSKSWTDDLNDESKQLSAALEAHAEAHSERGSAERPVSATNSLSSSPPEPSFLMHRAKSATFEIQQVQKGSTMIDPLPISKEKEAVLGRTRPSWLPPKDRQEEKRHLKEWQQMMARAAENDKRRALKLREAEETQVEMKGSIARIWDQHVLPNWELVVKEPRTRELWWRGVTPRSRGVVWQRAIGNELELSDSSFDAALKRANELEETVSELTPEERTQSKEAAWFDAISRDIVNACPELTSPEKRTPFESALSDILKAYTVYRSDVGYVYGTHLVAGVLCLHLPPSEAFVALANTLNRPIPLAFHIHDTAAMARAYDLVLSTLNYKFTKLHGHLTSPAVGLKPEEYLDPIFRCLFAYHLPVGHVSRVWDIFVFEGDKTLVRAAVAVLGKLEGKLYGTKEEILDVLGWRGERRWDLRTEEEFITAVREAGKVDSKGEVKSS